MLFLNSFSLQGVHNLLGFGKLNFFFFYTVNKLIIVWAMQLELMIIFLWLQRMDQFGDGVIIYVSFTNLSFL